MEPGLVLATAAVLVGAVALRLRHKGLDPFEPLFMFVVAWAVMFVLRGIAMLISGEMTLRQVYDIRTGLVTALVAGLLGASAFTVGYLIQVWHPATSHEPEYVYSSRLSWPSRRCWAQLD